MWKKYTIKHPTNLEPGLVSISPLKNSFQYNKETKNVETNILTNTPLIFLNLGKRNILIVLHTKILKLNDKKITRYWLKLTCIVMI